MSRHQSWAECERHARNILGQEGFERQRLDLNGEYPTPAGGLGLTADRERQSRSALPAGAQQRLFPGKPTLFGETMEDAAQGRKKR